MVLPPPSVTVGEVNVSGGQTANTMQYYGFILSEKGRGASRVSEVVKHVQHYCIEQAYITWKKLRALCPFPADYIAVWWSVINEPLAKAKSFLCMLSLSTAHFCV